MEDGTVVHLLEDDGPDPFLKERESIDDPMVQAVI